MEAADWVERYRQFWELSFDRLEDHLRELQKRDKKNDQRKYSEVVRPERIVHDLGDGRVMTMVFDDVGGKTKLMLTIEMAESEEAERS